MPIFSLKCFRTDTQVARNRVRGFGLLKPHTVPARIVSPLSVAFSTLSAFQVESVEQPWDQSERGRCVGPKERRQARSPRTHAGGLRRGAAGTELPLAHGPDRQAGGRSNSIAAGER